MALPLGSVSHAGRSRSAHEPLPSLGLMCLLAVAVAGCGDNAVEPRLTPSTADAGRIASTVRALDPASSWLGDVPGACWVSMRKANGGHPAKPVALPLPPSLKTSKARIGRILYRGWSRGIAQPTLVAVCNYPDVAGARDYVAGILNARPMSHAQLKAFARELGVTGAERWSDIKSEFTLSTASAVVEVDGAASQSALAGAKTTASSQASLSARGPIMRAAAICDDPQPGCDNYGDPPPDPPPGGGGGGSYLICDTWAPECDEVVPDVAPEDTASDPLLSANVSASVPFQCLARTDNPHISPTGIYSGTINVHARTTCPVPVNHVIYLNLRRKQCLLWCAFSWFYTIGTNAPDVIELGVAYSDKNASSECHWRSGVYKGEGFHQAFTLDGLGYGETKLVVGGREGGLLAGVPVNAPTLEDK